MLVSFENLPDSARIWIYQSGRKFTNAEQDEIQQRVENFCQNWTAHGAPIRSSVKIYFHQFIVLAADESFNAASGCSIDTTLRLFQEIETQMGLSLLDRNSVAFKENDQITLYPQKELKDLFASGILKKTSLAFNNVVATKGELNNLWLVPAENTWIRRFIPKDMVAS